MASKSGPKKFGKDKEHALKAHKNRMNRLKHFNQNIKNNQGKRVDKIIAELVEDYKNVSFQIVPFSGSYSY